VDNLPETGTVIQLELGDTIPTHNPEEIYGVEDFSKVTVLGDITAEKLNEWKPREVLLASLARLDGEYKDKNITSMVVAFVVEGEDGSISSRWSACSVNRLEMIGLAHEIAAFYAK